MKTEETTIETTDNEYSDAQNALAAYLGCDPADLDEESYDHYGLTRFSLGSKEYAIGTEGAADDACQEYIQASIWAFNASFILSQCGLPHQLEPAIKTWKEKECEGANDALLDMVEKLCGLPDFIHAAIQDDGRGHFLNPYDGCEDEHEYQGETFYIYRLN